MNIKAVVSKVENHIYWKKIEWGFYDKMDDESFLKMAYKRKFGKELDLKNPVTFNEKLQWLKLHDRKPEYTTMVDKYEAKAYIAQKIGKEYVVPTLGVWDKFDDIDFTKLPNAASVLMAEELDLGADGRLELGEEGLNFTGAELTVREFMEEQQQKRSGLINGDSDHIAVEGHIGTWYAIDETEIGGEKFFLLEHEEHGDMAACVAVNERGKLVAEDLWNGFDEDFQEAVQKYLSEKWNILCTIKAMMAAFLAAIRNGQSRSAHRSIMQTA